jgi:hypothetical protein
MTRTTIVDMMVTVISLMFRAWLWALPDEQRLRLNGVERLVDEILGRVRVDLWNTTVAFWGELAEHHGARCRNCAHTCERSVTPTSVVVAGLTLSVPAAYYYCRTCQRGHTPVAQWIGLHRGLVSGEFERQVVSLSTRVSFHETARQMVLQHQQRVDVGKVERVTYAVARDAQAFLEMLHDKAMRNLEREPARKGVPLLIVTTDGGGAPVGVLVRPKPSDAKTFTPVRKLPTGKRDQTHREMRAIVAHGPEERGQQRYVDVHLSVLDHPEVSGERMLAVAAMAGLGSDTHVHGVFDMGNWIRPQFLASFGGYSHTICADQQHVRTYLKAAASTIFDAEPERQAWLDKQEGQMSGGRWRSIVAALGPGEQKDVAAARRYILNHHEDMNNYGQLRARGLPVASGEAEGAVRHMIRRRENIGGVWVEKHLPGIGALTTVWENGLWNEFFRWRDVRDVEAFRARQTGLYRRRFGGNRRGTSSPQHAIRAGPSVS